MGRNRIWTAAEDRELERRRATGENWVKTALALGRSVNACRKRFYCERARRAVPQAERRGSAAVTKTSRSGLPVVSVMMPVDLRDRIVAAADHRFETVAEWMRAACRMRLHFEERRARRTG